MEMLYLRSLRKIRTKLSPVAKIDNVSKQVSFFHQFARILRKTSLEIENTTKNYNAVEVNQANIANYLNVIEYLPSVSNLSKLDKLQ